MSETREFHLGDVLSITTEMLVSPRHIGGVYEILNFLTGDNLFTHQLPRANRECKPWVERQHPDLSAEALAPNIEKLKFALRDTANDPATVVGIWLGDMVAHFGETRTLRPIPREEHERVDPVTQAERMFGPERVIIATTEPPDPPSLDPSVSTPESLSP
jgi:hypothetical protein